MKIVSFNINSIRARPHQIEHLRDTIDPDIIGLQETKVNDPDFPVEIINEIGYHVEYWGQKGHYGVAILSKDGGSWQFTYMYYLGLIIGGGTSQIQKNIISERGLGMPREPKPQQAV